MSTVAGLLSMISRFPPQVGVVGAPPGFSLQRVTKRRPAICARRSDAHLAAPANTTAPKTAAAGRRFVMTRAATPAALAVVAIIVTVTPRLVLEGRWIPMRRGTIRIVGP